MAQEYLSLVLGLVMMAEGRVGTTKAKPESCTPVCMCLHFKNRSYQEWVLEN